MTKTKTLTPLIALIACLAIALTVLTGCAGGSSSSSSNSKLYEDWDGIDGSVTACILPSSETLIYGGSGTNAKSISFVFMFQDSYGDELGEYFCTWNRNQPPQVDEVISGLRETDSGVAYIYSYSLEDGSQWGNKDLPQTSAGIEEAMKYGKEIPVGINRPMITYLNKL